MLMTFRQFIKESNTTFAAVPDIEVSSLEDFLSKETPVGPASLSEDDAAEPFGLGATVRDMSDDEMQGYLQRIFTRSNPGPKGPRPANAGERAAASDAKRQAKKERNIDRYTLPYIHNKILKPSPGTNYLLKPGSDVVVNAETGAIMDADALMALMSERPGTLLKQNQKMIHSGGNKAMFFNFGIPALKGLAVDEKNHKFVVVNTCPGAGACKLYCYALKAGYIQYPEASIKATRAMNFLLNDPKGFFDQVATEVATQKEKFGTKFGVKIIIRWHDAGDFFSPQYQKMFFDLCRKFPDVDFYAYTKIASVAKGDKPDNVTINFSQGALPGEEGQVDTKTTKHSAVVRGELFDDLTTRKPILKNGVPVVDPKTKKEKTVLKFKSPAAIKEFKQRMAKKFDIDVKTILTYDEMGKMPVGKEQKWNVIVVPGEGDVSASRRDVLGTYLLIH